MDGIVTLINLYMENILFIFAGLFLIVKNNLFGTFLAKSQMSVNDILGKNTPESLERDYGSKCVKIIGVAFIVISIVQIYQKTNR